MLLFHLVNTLECDCQIRLSSLRAENRKDAKSHLHGPHLPRAHRGGKRIWMTENGVARHFKRWLSWPSHLYLHLASWNAYHVLLILLHHLQFFSTKLRSVIHFSETPLSNRYQIPFFISFLTCQRESCCTIMKSCTWQIQTPQLEGPVYNRIGSWLDISFATQN